MIGLAGYNLPAKAVRKQIASAIDMIVQVSRMHDGMRRITHIEEIVGMEGDIITSVWQAASSRRRHCSATSSKSKARTACCSAASRSDEHTSALQSLMRTSSAS